jgi:peptidoglycan-associated lipoprotein
MRSVHVLPVIFLLVAACSHAEPAPTRVATPQPIAQPTPVSAAAPVAPPAPAPLPAAPVRAAVYFSFDSSELSSESQSTLQATSDQAQAYSADGIRIEGNCDERGSREYNIALGQRRADAAKRYLINLGVDASRVTAISYGKERPRALGHDEAAWRQNRRDDVIPSSSKTAPAAVTQSER